MSITLHAGIRVRPKYKPPELKSLGSLRLHLPNEIKDMIFDHVKDRKTLKNFRLVSRAINVLVTKYCFRDLKVKQALPELMQLDNIAYSQVGLAAHVKSIELTPPDFRCAGCGPDHDECLAHDAELAERMARVLQRSLKRFQNLKDFRWTENNIAESHIGVTAGLLAGVLEKGTPPQYCDELDLEFRNVDYVTAFCAELTKSGLSRALSANQALRMKTTAAVDRVAGDYWEDVRLGNALRNAIGHLEHLELAFEQYDRKLFRFPGPVFANLKTLRLHGFMIDIGTFLKAIQPSLPTLRAMRLSSIAAHSGRYAKIFTELKDHAPDLDCFGFEGLDYCDGGNPCGRWMKSRCWNKIVTTHHADLHACRDLFVCIDDKLSAAGVAKVYEGRARYITDRQFSWISALSSLEVYQKFGAEKRWSDGESHKMDEAILRQELATVGEQIQW